MAGSDRFRSKVKHIPGQMEVMVCLVLGDPLALALWF